MDVLVTGATGFVGANVARLLVADGYRVRVLARPASRLQALSGCPHLSRREMYLCGTLRAHEFRHQVRPLLPRSDFGGSQESTPHKRIMQLVDALRSGKRFVFNACDRTGIQLPEVGRIARILPTTRHDRLRTALFERSIIEICIRPGVKDLLGKR